MLKLIPKYVILKYQVDKCPNGEFFILVDFFGKQQSSGFAIFECEKNAILWKHEQRPSIEFQFQNHKISKDDVIKVSLYRCNHNKTKLICFTEVSLLQIIEQHFIIDSHLKLLKQFNNHKYLSFTYILNLKFKSRFKTSNYFNNLFQDSSLVIETTMLNIRITNLDSKIIEKYNETVIKNKITLHPNIVDFKKLFLHIEINKLKIEKNLNIICSCEIKLRNQVKLTKSLNLIEDFKLDERFLFEISKQELINENIEITISHSQDFLSDPTIFGKFTYPLKSLSNHDPVHCGIINKWLKFESFISCEIQMKATLFVSESKNFITDSSDSLSIASRNEVICSLEELRDKETNFVLRLFSIHIYHLRSMFSKFLKKSKKILIRTNQNSSKDTTIVDSSSVSTLKPIKECELEAYCEISFVLSGNVIKDKKPIKIPKGYLQSKCENINFDELKFEYKIKSSLLNTLEIRVVFSFLYKSFKKLFSTVIELNKYNSIFEKCDEGCKHFKSGGLLYNLFQKYTNSSTIIAGHFLFQFEFSESIEDRSETSKTFAAPSNESDLSKVEIRKRDYIMLIVPHGIYRLPSLIDNLISLRCRFENTLFSRASFKYEVIPFTPLFDELNNQRYFQWNSIIPTLLFKFKWLDESYKFYLVNLIENFLRDLDSSQKEISKLHCLANMSNDLCNILQDIKTFAIKFETLLPDRNEYPHCNNQIDVYVETKLRDLTGAFLNDLSYFIEFTLTYNESCLIDIMNVTFQVNQLLIYMMNTVHDIRIKHIEISLPDFVIDIFDWHLLKDSNKVVSLYNLKIPCHTMLYTSKEPKYCNRQAGISKAYFFEGSTVNNAQQNPFIKAEIVLFLNKNDFSLFCKKRITSFLIYSEIWQNEMNVLKLWVKSKKLMNVSGYSNRDGSKFTNTKAKKQLQSQLSEKYAIKQFSSLLNDNNNLKIDLWYLNDYDEIVKAINSSYETTYEIQVLCSKSQSESDNNWKTKYYSYIKDNILKIKKSKHVRLDGEWYPAMSHETKRWEYSNNIHQEVWHGKTANNDIFKYRRCKWVKTNKCVSSNDSWKYARSFASNFYSYKKFNNVSRTRQFVNFSDEISNLDSTDACTRLLGKHIQKLFLKCPNSTNSYILKVYIEEAKIMKNICLYCPKNLFDGVINNKAILNFSTSFFKITIHFYNSTKTIVCKNICNGFDIYTNPLWDESFEIEFYDSNKEAIFSYPIHIYLTFHYCDPSSNIQYQIGTATLYPKTVKELTLVKADNIDLFSVSVNNKTSKNTKEMKTAILRITEFVLVDSAENNIFKSHIVEHVTITLTIFNFGIRFSDYFPFKVFSNARALNELKSKFVKNYNNILEKPLIKYVELVFVLGSQIQKSILTIEKNYAFPNKDNQITLIHSQNSSFPVSIDIYLRIPLDENKEFISENTLKRLNKKIIGFNRIIDVLPNYNKIYNPQIDKLLSNSTDLNTRKNNSKEYLTYLMNFEAFQNIFFDYDENEFDFWTRYYESLKYRSDKPEFNRINRLFLFDVLQNELEVEYHDYNESKSKSFKIFDYLAARKAVKNGFDFESLCNLNNDELTNKEIQEIKKMTIGELKSKIAISIKKPDESKPQNENETLYTSITQPKLFYKLPCECLIRLYVIKAFILQGVHEDGDNRHYSANPYIEIFCKGFSIDRNIHLSNKDSFIEKNLNPEFGKAFEFNVNIPEHTALEIRILHRNTDLIKFEDSDEIIGVTEINLEDRLTSLYRSTCGLPALYIEDKEKISAISQSNPKLSYFLAKRKQNIELLKWRDVEKPSCILRKTAKITQKELNLVENDLIATLNNEIISLNDFNLFNLNVLYLLTTNIFEQFCLNILNTRFSLVKEHIETRTLYNFTNKKMEVGKVHLWLDILPLHKSEKPSIGISSLVNIEPRTPIHMELRCIIWDVSFQGLNIEQVNQTKNIYVKGWLVGQETYSQTTDTHLRCTNKASFNYRLIYEFNYLRQEKCVVKVNEENFYNFLPKTNLMSQLQIYKSNVNKSTKTSNSRDKSKPSFVIQIYNSDLLGISNDILGEYEFNLNELNSPSHKEPDFQNCSLFNIKSLTQILPNTCMKMVGSFNGHGTTNPKKVDLFKEQRLEGWWKCKSVSNKFQNDEQTNNSDLVCYIRMSLEILDSAKAKLKPAGSGRSEPNSNPKLAEPDREPLFQNSFFNPINKVMSIFKQIFSTKKKNFASYICIGIVILFIALCLFALPSAIMNRLVTKII